ncbi:hypothetical protein D3C73_1267740 [compost metagenome]
MFLAPAASIVVRLLGFTDVIRSNIEPNFRNLGEKPANGPKNSSSFLSMTRVSRCGTDMGGAPSAAFPYTLA